MVGRLLGTGEAVELGVSVALDDGSALLDGVSVSIMVPPVSSVLLVDAVDATVVVSCAGR